MKAYRIESRKEEEWAWGFNMLYYFNLLLWLVISIMLERIILYLVIVLFGMIIHFIVFYDLVGYKVGDSKQKRGKK